MLWFNQWGEIRVQCEKKVTRGMTEFVESLPVLSHVSFPWECLPTAWLHSLPAFCATFNCFEVTIRYNQHNPLFFFPFSFTFMKVFVPFYFTKRSHMTLTYVHLQNEPITILKLSRMHDVRGSLHTDVLWYYLDCNSKRQANGFAAPTEPVPTHQRYHSDFSSSSESPSVTSSDPDYGQGRRTEWNIYHSTWLLKERKGCIPLRKLNVCIWYEGWCLRTAWL